jgi:hypothetical protein
MGNAGRRLAVPFILYVSGGGLMGMGVGISSGSCRQLQECQRHVIVVVVMVVY